MVQGFPLVDVDKLKVKDTFLLVSTDLVKDPSLCDPKYASPMQVMQNADLVFGRNMVLPLAGAFGGGRDGDEDEDPISMVRAMGGCLLSRGLGVSWLRGVAWRGAWLAARNVRRGQHNVRWRGGRQRSNALTRGCLRLGMVLRARTHAGLGAATCVEEDRPRAVGGQGQGVAHS